MTHVLYCILYFIVLHSIPATQVRANNKDQRYIPAVDYRLSWEGVYVWFTD